MFVLQAIFLLCPIFLHFLSLTANHFCKHSLDLMSKIECCALQAAICLTVQRQVNCLITILAEYGQWGILEH